jgi:hypothetical protein
MAGGPFVVNEETFYQRRKAESHRRGRKECGFIRTLRQNTGFPTLAKTQAKAWVTPAGICVSFFCYSSGATVCFFCLTLGRTNGRVYYSRRGEKKLQADDL